MSIDWRKYWWQPGFALAFFTVGVPYWLIPYKKLNLPDALLGAELIVVFAVAALARVYSGRSFLRVAMVMGSAVPAVVMVRVVVDGVLDYSAHNLWPFEVVIAVLVGGIVSVAGALAGSLVLWIARRG
jgi:hypothetical protein